MDFTAKKRKNRLIKDIRNKEKGLDHIVLDDSTQLEQDAEYTSVKNWAKLSGMESDYNMIYRLFSGNIHISASSVEWDYEQDLTGPYMSIAPRSDDVGIIVLTVCEYMLKAIDTVLSYFKLDFPLYREMDSKLESLQKMTIMSFNSDNPTTANSQQK